MKEIFTFIFYLRYIKPVKLKISIFDILKINSFYRAFKIKRWITFKDFYIKVINYCTEYSKDFETGSRDVSYIIIDEKLMTI